MNNTITEIEAIAIAEAIESGALRAADARSDFSIDADPLCDSNREGERIADGFAILNSLES